MKDGGRSESGTLPSSFLPHLSSFKTGGHEGTRTPNFLLVREAVYQLTYVPENRIKTELFCTRTLIIFKKTSLNREIERTVIVRKQASNVKADMCLVLELYENVLV